MKRAFSLALVVAMAFLSAGPAQAAPSADITYTVQLGDTLFAIALRFGVTVQAIMQANGLTNADRIFVGQRLTIPGVSGSAPATGGASGVCGATYTVQRGDTLKIIASKCGATFSAIASLNGLANPDLIFVGQALRMPASSGGVVSTPTPITAPSATPAPSSGGSSRCGAVYIIQRGDTLRIIAEKCGVTAQAIIANNVLPNPNLIFVGQQLSIPGGSPNITPAPTTAPSAATPTPAPVTTGHGVTGTLTLCNPEKPSFASKIETICFTETIVNHTSGNIPYGILGVRYENLSGGPSGFHTSWRGDLVINAGCTGPTDSCGGPTTDFGMRIDTAGVYRLTLSMCFSSVDACLAGGAWEVLTSGVTVKVVDWTP